MSAAVDENGVITVEQDHCSVYLLTTTKLTQTHVSGSGTQAAAPNTGDRCTFSVYLTRSCYQQLCINCYWHYKETQKFSFLLKTLSDSVLAYKNI